VTDPAAPRQEPPGPAQWDEGSTWLYSPEHGEPCRVVEKQRLWGQELSWVWLPRQGVVVQVPSSSLRPLQMLPATVPDDIAYVATAAKIADALSQDVLLAPIEASVLALPHQILALERAISGGSPRLLLADEVGLGKTIEAGLILRELKLRGLVERTLVLAPRGLVSQWASEMLLHFGEVFHLMRPEDLGSLGRMTSVGLEASHADGGGPLGAAEGNPWRMFPQVIASIDSVKPVEKKRGWGPAKLESYNRDRFESLVDAGWDLVIVDEAHRLGGTTEQVARFKLGQAVAEAAPFILLLTATPHQGKSDSFCRLFSLLDPLEFPDEASVTRDRIRPYVVRTEKRKAIDADGRPLFGPRSTHLHAVSWQFRHKEQRALYEAVTDYVRDGYSQARQQRRNAIGFLMVLMQRLVVSSTSAIRAALERRLDVLERTAAQAPAVSANGEDEWQEMDGQEQVELLLGAQLGAMTNEHSEVESLLQAASRCTGSGPDAKAEALLEWIYRLQSEEGEPELKVLIFTEFVATQEMLRGFLADRGFRVACLNGSMDMNERLRAQEAFAGECRILVSTDAGGEGLNLQFCHVVVNFDIPWNPMRLEQRIGRVDRIGQTRTVRAINLVLEGSVEHRVQEVLEEKLATILREFGVDKTGDVLDSAQADEVFEDLYIESILDPARIGERVDKTLALLRQRFEEARRGSTVVPGTADLSPDAARRLVSHPLPHWVERMTVSYLRGHGGAADAEGAVWHLRWPTEQAAASYVFNARSAMEHPTARHLGLQDSRMRALVNEAPPTLPGMPVLEVSMPGIAAGISGLWSLWRIRLASESWKRDALLPLFQTDDGKLLAPTARRIWDALVGEEARVRSTLGTAASRQAHDQAYSAAEEHGKALYESLRSEHRAFVVREREKSEYAFAARRRAIGRIGLPEVRNFRLSALSAEEKEFSIRTERRTRAFPAILPLLILRVRAGQGG